MIVKWRSWTSFSNTNACNDNESNHVKMIAREKKWMGKREKHVKKMYDEEKKNSTENEAMKNMRQFFFGVGFFFGVRRSLAICNHAMWIVLRGVRERETAHAHTHTAACAHIESVNAVFDGSIVCDLIRSIPAASHVCIHTIELCAQTTVEYVDKRSME